MTRYIPLQTETKGSIFKNSDNLNRRQMRENKAEYYCILRKFNSQMKMLLALRVFSLHFIEMQYAQSAQNVCPVWWI